MKIKKFNESAEAEQHYYAFVVNEDISMKDFTSDIFLFENKEAAFNFLVDRMYNKFQEQDLELDELDDMIVENYNDIDNLYGSYLDVLQTHDYFDNLTLDAIPISNKWPLESWIEKRLKLKIDTKKYNL